MIRPVAFFAFLALSWSHVAGLRCDMGASAAPVDEGQSGAVASHGHHTTPATEAPPTHHPATTGHDGSHGCLMIMACSVASPRPARTDAMIRIPAVIVRAAFPAPPILVATDLAVETPPPRHTV